MVNRKRVRRMQIDLKAAEGEIGVNMIIEVSFQIQLINRNEKISGWSFLILGSSCKSRGTEIYLWTDPACYSPIPCPRYVPPPPGAAAPPPRREGSCPEST